MSTNIKCPHCASEFDVQNVLSADAEQKLKQQYEKQFQQTLARLDAEKKKLEDEQKTFEERKKRENELFQQRLQQALQKQEADLQQQLRKSIAAGYENELRLLKQKEQENEERLKEALQKEYEFLKKEQALENKKREMEITVQKRVMEEGNRLAEMIRREEAEKASLKDIEQELKMKEKDVQLEGMKKTIEELKRKSEEGSNRIQGEAQEVLLEEILQSCFQFDTIKEVAKGKRGGDCILVVRDRTGTECGTILFESKRTAFWGKDWIEKLKQDKINSKADIAVLVSQTLPDKMPNKYDCKDEIWICGFTDVKMLTAALREGLISVYKTIAKNEGKGDKIQLLYAYLTGNDFASQWKSIRDVFANMQYLLTEEKRVMEKLWKNREKQLERALLNSDHIMGSIEGIAGKNIIDLDMRGPVIEMEDEGPQPKMFIK